MKKADGCETLRSGIKRSLCLIGDGEDIGDENGDDESDEHPDIDRIKRRSKSGSMMINLMNRTRSINHVSTKKNAMSTITNND